MIKLLEQVCQQHNVQCIPVKAEDIDYNIQILYGAESILFYDETITSERLKDILPHIINALQNKKDKLWAFFNENGMPENWSKGGVVND